MYATGYTQSLQQKIQIVNKQPHLIENASLALRLQSKSLPAVRDHTPKLIAFTSFQAWPSAIIFNYFCQNVSSD